MARRWTRHRRQQLLDSRVGLTAELCRWMAQLERRPDVLINASAIGYYGVLPQNGDDGVPFIAWGKTDSTIYAVVVLGTPLNPVLETIPVNS